MKKIIIKQKGKTILNKEIKNYSKELRKVQNMLNNDFRLSKQLSFYLTKKLNREGFIFASTWEGNISISIEEVEEKVNIDYEVIKETEMTEAEIKNLVLSRKNKFKIDEFNDIEINGVDIVVFPYYTFYLNKIFNVRLL